MPVWMWWLVTALAVARLTGLIARDEISRPAREALVSRLNPHRRAHRWAVYLLGGADDNADGCPWCLSIWCAAVVVPLAWSFPHHPAVGIPLTVLAASQVAGMTAGIGRG